MYYSSYVCDTVAIAVLQEVMETVEGASATITVNVTFPMGGSDIPVSVTVLASDTPNAG